MSRKRKIESVDGHNMADPSQSSVPESGISNLARSVKGLFEKVAGSGQPDPTNPVVNGASTVQQGWLRNLLGEISSQAPRLAENVGLITSLANSQIFDGGLLDDRKYQMEQIVQLAASLPIGSKALDDLSSQFIKVLWQNLRHPPLSYQGDEYKYRTADGSNNNIMYPHLGVAGSYYARTVTPQTLKPGVPPDAGLLFDTLMARSQNEEVKEHPNKISSMLFYLASIIIHDCFHTDERDSNIVKTSSYLDLSPLYGSSQEEQNGIRTFEDGLLKPDTFANYRVLGFPPGVSAMLICFNRFHNYVAKQLKEINEHGRFTPPEGKNDAAWKKFDNDLFQTARLVTCGLYVNIILIDYVRTILNLNRSDSTWSLDPRVNFGEVFDSAGTPSGVGNQVSVEFNLVYRWHSTISARDEKWSDELYEELFPGMKTADIDRATLTARLRKWVMDLGTDASQWTLDNGKIKRLPSGYFTDEDLAKVLTESIEDCAAAFGPRQVPVVMRLIEMMGIEQARSWQVATLNEFRQFFGLQPHKEFTDITRNEEVAEALQTLYGHPDYVELYPGIVVEDAKKPLEPGSGLCPGYTISRNILADAVSLVRGDRFYTVDYTPANLTNFGWNLVNSDPNVAQGGCFYKLLMRALPLWFKGNSVYAMFPLVVPEENRNILAKLGKEEDYDFERPAYTPVPTAVRTWKGVTSVLGDRATYRVPWADHTTYVTGHDYMLSNDGEQHDEQKAFDDHALFCPVNGLEQIRIFYEDLTTQLVQIHSQRLGGDLYQLDACADVANPSHTIFMAKMFQLPLKGPNDVKVGATVDQLYLAMSVLFAYVFLDLDPASSFKLRSAAKQAGDQIGELAKLVVESVKVGNTLHLSSLFNLGHAGQLLSDYGTNLMSRLLEGGKSADEVVSNIIPTMAAGVASHGQHSTQMIDVFLRDEYQQHWPEIQRLAWSDEPEDFDMLKGYALEANRLAPGAFGLLRICDTDNASVQDGRSKVSFQEGEEIFLDFVAAGLDESVFENPHEIIPTRDRKLYIHHGWGSHACLGRPIVEIAQAAQLKVFAKLKDLKRAPGLQGQMKGTIPPPNPVSSDPKPNPGSIEVYLKPDWSDWWPFPTTLKVHHSGFWESQDAYLNADTGIPDRTQELKKSQMRRTPKGAHTGTA